jgi:hypothetical protein
VPAVTYSSIQQCAFITISASPAIQGDFMTDEEQEAFDDYIDMQIEAELERQAGIL